MKKLIGMIGIIVVCLTAFFGATNAQTDGQATDQGPALPAVIESLSKEFGIEPDQLKAETDLVTDIGVDRTQLYYALQKLYLDQKVEAPDEELSQIGAIAAFIDLQRELDLTLRSGDLEKNAYYTQRVYFATTRLESEDDDMRKRFGGGRVRDQKLRYGHTDVNIPLSHKKGRIETPFRSIRILEDPRKHVFITDVTVQDTPAFYAELKERFSNTDEGILVYIHGYNVSFEDAMLRGAQIAVDFGFNGLPIAFSWPSNGRTASYASDWADALWSAHYLEGFLAELKTRFGDRPVHIVSHSMGNKVLLHAMRQMAARGVDAGIENVILCAPDFDAQFFVEQIATAIRPLAKHWTIYTSENDLALNISSRLSDAPRLGSPNPIVDGYEIIDASKIEVSPWSVPENHSYYAVKSRVINDIAAVLAGTRPEKRKLTLREGKAGTVWAF